MHPHRTNDTTSSSNAWQLTSTWMASAAPGMSVRDADEEVGAAVEDDAAVLSLAEAAAPPVHTGAAAVLPAAAASEAAVGWSPAHSNVIPQRDAHAPVPAAAASTCWLRSWKASCTRASGKMCVTISLAATMARARGAGSGCPTRNGNGASVRGHCQGSKCARTVDDAVQDHLHPLFKVAPHVDVAAGLC